MLNQLPLICGLLLSGATPTSYPAPASQPPLGRLEAIIDLGTREGCRLVNGTWRYSNTRIVEVDAKAPGPDLQASGGPIKTYDYLPKAGVAHFDDSAWEVIDPTTLEQRRSTGKLCFNWYRMNVTIPERVGAFNPTGAVLALEVVVDDYAEVWVDGKLPVVLGQLGGPIVTGFNAPNRVILTQDAKPGQRIQLAIFGINGPISRAPDNFIFIRSATLDFYKPAPKPASDGTIVRKDSALDAIVAESTTIEKMADGFQFTEGPIWSPDGTLLFSDIPANAIYRLSPDGRISIFRTKSGYRGIDIGEFSKPGSNGLTFDSQGLLTIAEHGNRRVSRVEKSGALTVLVDKYEGKRLNSPNDLVYRSDGALYFTDPPFGLPKGAEDPRKELSFSGVYCLLQGKLRLLIKDLLGPNGLAFSPDEKYLYVDNSDPKKKIVMRYDVHPDGSLSNGKLFFDMTSSAAPGSPDGMKVDEKGNLYVSGPGGVWIVSPGGKHLGTIQLTELPANLAWGDKDGRALYITARTAIYRVHLNVAGRRPGMRPAPLTQRTKN